MITIKNALWKSFKVSYPSGQCSLQLMQKRLKGKKLGLRSKPFQMHSDKNHAKLSCKYS